MMNCLVPLAIGQSIKLYSYESTIRQSIPINIVECASEGIVNSNHEVITFEDRIKKFECEGVSRNSCVQKAKEFGEEYFSIQDRDIVHLHNNNFQHAITILNNDKRIGCVLMSLYDGIQPSGFRNACSVFRLSSVNNLVYDTKYLGGDLCHCQTQKRLVEGLTVWSGYEKRCYEILAI